MFNSLKILNKAFDYIKEEEKKLYYEFEPHFDKEDDTWKRHLFFFELKKDFIKDVTEFGFCPYIQKPCEEQRRDKNIMRFKKADNFKRTDYIKNLYRKITSNAKCKMESNSPLKVKKTLILKKTKSMKNIKYNKRLNNKNSFLSNFYNKINKKRKELNKLKLNQNMNLNKNIDINDNTTNQKINKFDEGQADIESFIYEPEKGHLRYNNVYRPNRESFEKYNKKDDSISEYATNNKNDIPNNNKAILYNTNNGEIKKNGWKLTTSLEGTKYYRKINGEIPYNKNIFNNNNNMNGFSFLETNKNNKICDNYLKKNSKSNKLYKSHSGKLEKNNSLYKKVVKKDNKKYSNRNFRLFNHVRIMRSELENE